MSSFDWVEALGLLAGAQTTFAFLPQALKVWRAKSADDISLATFLIFCSGVTCWFFYGLFIDSLSVILANAVTLILAASIVWLKVKYTRRKSMGASCSPDESR
ncbi:SemiSWEET transporter [Desulfocurvibacter africanus]|uniref:MtN3/saliva-related transmembrane protein, conserved region n=1 Tax=Desulfocurvibacter africanus subsp. africanus str. Walvis Bay TaxID=690850 RepID=F3Z1L7_DESAF|nr:SemiSWEET transporter [Desulfocurvibacter africanus]EGJ51152.1 MtN3/saliva-related transmembrane protein, conserved region [Desulfocurvibacter africanus subsp. africanus str. Walvis Bay]